MDAKMIMHPKNYTRLLTKLSLLHNSRSNIIMKPDTVKLPGKISFPAVKPLKKKKKKTIKHLSRLKYS